MTGTSLSAHSEAELSFLGQMGFKFRFGETVVYIDPFLSDHPRRQFPSPMSVEELCDADLILGTHDHKDHIDRAAWTQVAESSPDVVFIVPELLLRQGLADDLNISSGRFVGMTHAQAVSLNGVRITAVASAHEFLDQDGETGLFPYLGYVIEWEGFTLYHAGDTCRYEGLETFLKQWHLDVMVLPINGRDAERYADGCVGNMTYQEAVDLAGEVGPQVVIPGHHDLFAHNGENPKLFADYLRAKYPNQKYYVMESGKKFFTGENYE